MWEIGPTRRTNTKAGIGLLVGIIEPYVYTIYVNTRSRLSGWGGVGETIPWPVLNLKYFCFGPGRRFDFRLP
jgi:hypothetical protein